MGSIEAWAEFFGWCTVLNMGLYLLTVGALSTVRGLAARINARIFGISEEEVLRVAFGYVGLYKLAITMLCFVPWLALVIMS